MSNGLAVDFLKLIVSLGCLSLFARWFAGVGIGAPYVPARRRDIKDAIALAHIGADDIVIDLGSGDGCILEAAAMQGARVIGYELNPFLVWYSRFRLRRFGDRAVVYRNDLFTADLKEPTIIFLFQITHIMPRIAQKLQREKPSGRIISFVFDLPGFRCVAEKGVVKEFSLELL